MAEHDDAELGGQCAALEDAAHPGLYRRNAFRVSGVTVEASPRDISRQVEKLQLMQKYGTNGVARSPLAIEPPPDEHAVRAALHDLNDPERRLIDEFFWFWPLQMGQTKTDRALTSLSAGDIPGASAAWLEAERSSEAYVSTHNLAVLHHCLALDLEAAAATRLLTAEERTQLEKHWDATSRRWQALIGHEAFWSRLSNRIRALEDPRLTTGLARRIREALPGALLAVNAALAVRTAEAGEFVAAKRHVETMNRLEGTVATRASTVGDQKVLPASKKALKQALSPLRKRIRSVCEDLEAKVDADPVQGDRITRELVAHTAPLLKVFDELLGAGDATRDAVRDEVAAIALRCQIPYGNKTEKWRVCMELLELIQPIAASKATQALITENMKVVRGNITHGACWFCEDNDAVDACTTTLAMHGDVRTEFRLFGGNRVTWRTSTVRIPRCKRCKEAHESSSGAQGIGLMVGALVGFGTCMATDQGGGGFIAFLVLGAVGWGIGSMAGASKRPAGVKPIDHASEFPGVLALKSMGWSFGDKPSNVR